MSDTNCVDATYQNSSLMKGLSFPSIENLLFFCLSFRQQTAETDFLLWHSAETATPNTHQAETMFGMFLSQISILGSFSVADAVM